MNDLRAAVRAFTQKRDREQFHSPKNLAMTLSVEVSEVVEHFQWLTKQGAANLPVDKLAEVKEEIGDVTIYLTELADKLGIDTVEAAKAKVAPPPHDPTSGIRAKRLVHTSFFFT